MVDSEDEDEQRKLGTGDKPFAGVMLALTGVREKVSSVKFDRSDVIYRFRLGGNIELGWFYGGEF